MTDCKFCLNEKDGKCVLFNKEMSALSCSYKENDIPKIEIAQIGRRKRRYIHTDSSLYDGTQILWEEDEHNPHPVLEDDALDSSGGGEFGGGGASGDWDSSDDSSSSSSSSCDCGGGSDD